MLVLALVRALAGRGAGGSTITDSKGAASSTMTIWSPGPSP